jgi:hypothetical protein
MPPSVKVAQPGWNVTTAPDWALMFSSEWPSLQIAFEKTITITAGNAVNFTIYHNLNYVSLASAWISTPSTNYGRVANLEMTTVFCAGFALGTYAEDVTVTLRCYNIDVTKEVAYSLPQSASSKQTPDYTTGIKIVKENPTRQISSTNMNDFILNSQCQSPAVLNVATQSGSYYSATGGVGGQPAIIYPLQTNYIPWVQGVVGLDGNTSYQYYNASDLIYNEGGNELILNFGEVSSYASLIVLRDPLFYPNTVRVVY